jgi:hypothetical protein
MFFTAGHAPSSSPLSPSPASMSSKVTPSIPGLQHWTAHLPTHAAPATPEDSTGRFRFHKGNFSIVISRKSKFLSTIAAAYAKHASFFGIYDALNLSAAADYFAI